MTEQINLASARLGAQAIRATDEFFAPLERMLMDSDPVFIDDKFDDHGKWMDGWETRRRRQGGHDYAVIQLAMPGYIDSIDIDTSHFTGNYPPAAAIEGIYYDNSSDNSPDSSNSGPADDASWIPLVALQSLAGDSHNRMTVNNTKLVNYLRVHIYPDGGIARLRAYGRVHKDWSQENRKANHELSALANGGTIVAYNDAHFGNVSSLLSANPAKNMGDGWETRRRREPGYDWIILALGTAGIASSVEIDTAHFKGNFPDACSLQAALLPPDTPSNAIITQSQFWPELMGKQTLSADAVHHFSDSSLVSKQAISHVKLNIYPDGGISRFRLFGRMT